MRKLNPLVRLAVRTLALVAAAVACGAMAAQADETEPYFRVQPTPDAGVNLVRSWWSGGGLLPQGIGHRDALAAKGIDVFGGYTAEVWGNTTGGERTGSVYTGLLDFGVDLDLEELFGWSGASAGTTWLWISGRDISETDVGNFLTVSNIAGFQTLRMFELWLQQNLWEDRVSLRVGQLAADEEFVISDYAAVFINGTFGWPAFLYMNLPSGGPGYPMGAPGIRLAIQPTGGFTWLSAIFQGNVYDQNVNRHGFRWRLDGENGFLFLNEAQLRWNRGDGAGRRLPGQAKAGAWIQTGKLADVLAESTGSGNYGIYLILDQAIYRPPSHPREKNDGKRSGDDGGSAAGRGLGYFGRIAFADPDRNFLNFYFDTGLAYTGLIPGREADVLGVAFAYAQLGNAARSDLASGGAMRPGAEMVVEATYQFQLTEWLSVQPDLQFVIHPGGTRDAGSALVIGCRASVVF